MKARPDPFRRLRLELLETRTLLAADLADPFGLTSDLNLALQAITGSGDYHASFSSNFGNHQLIITGGAESALTINLDQLPSFVTNIKLSTFGSVIMTGNDHVDDLILTDIGSVNASGLSVTRSVTTVNVDSLSLASIDYIAVLSGQDMKLTVPKLGDIAVIYSDLKTLTLSSEAKNPLVNALNPDQTLILTYVPEKLGIAGIPQSSVKVVLPPAGGGTSTPDTPTDPSTPTDPGTPSNGGTDTPATPNPDPTQLVIITLPLDEQARAFSEQLRHLLHSSQSDLGQQLFEFVTQGEHGADSLNPAFVAEMSRTLGSVTGPVSKFGDGTDLPPLSDPGHFDLTTPNPIGINLSIPVLKSELFPSRIDDSTFQHAAGGLDTRNLVDVELSWPVALPVADAQRSPGTRKAQGSDASDLSVADGVKALGTYIVDRIVAEFSPGQQSLVLLVDPQPTRPVESRKAAAERAASPTVAPSLAANPIVI